MPAQVEAAPPTEADFAKCQELAATLQGRVRDNCRQLQELGFTVQQTEVSASRLCYNLSDLDGKLLVLSGERDKVLAQVAAARAVEMQQAQRHLQASYKAELQRRVEVEKALEDMHTQLKLLSQGQQDVLTLQQDNARLRLEADDLRSQLAATTQQLADAPAVADASVELKQNNARLVELVQQLTVQLESQKQRNTQLIQDMQQLEELKGACPAPLPDEALAKRVKELEDLLSASVQRPTCSVECQTSPEKEKVQVPQLPVARAAVPEPTPVSSPPAPAKQRPVLGLEVQFPNQAGKGLMVSLVKPDGPAKEAGIQVGDLLVKLDGAPIPSDKEHFDQLIKRHKVGDEVVVEVLRDGETLELPVKFAGMDAKPPSTPSPRKVTKPRSKPAK